MTIVYDVADVRQASEAAAAAEAAAEALRAGRLVVFPTETVYGIASLAGDADATARLFGAKRRPAGLALPVMAASADAALRLTHPDERARALADAFWPGPLTIVMPRSDVSRPWALGNQPDTIGLRVPDHPVANAILTRTPPLAVTSANLSGSPPAATLAELQVAFGDTVAVFVVQSEPLRQEQSPPSTVVDLTAGGTRIARVGLVSNDAIAEVVRHALGEVTG